MLSFEFVFRNDLDFVDLKYIVSHDKVIRIFWFLWYKWKCTHSIISDRKYRQKYLQSAQYFDLVNFCNKKWDNRVKRYHTRKLWNRHHRFKNDVWYMMIRIVKQFNQVRLCTLFFFCHFVDNGWIVISLSHFYCWNFAYEVNDSYIKCVNRFLSFCSLFFFYFYHCG